MSAAARRPLVSSECHRCLHACCETLVCIFSSYTHIVVIVAPTDNDDDVSERLRQMPHVFECVLSGECMYLNVCVCV